VHWWCLTSAPTRATPEHATARSAPSVRLALSTSFSPFLQAYACTSHSLSIDLDPSSTLTPA
jgi:hypothetical protein